MTVQKFKRHELFDGILSLVLAWIFLSFFSGVFLYEIAICFVVDASNLQVNSETPKLAFQTSK